MNKNWVVAFATEKFYLTEKDAKDYCQAVAGGAKFVLLKSGLMLSDKALYVVPVEKFDETKQLEAKKWRCEFGNWHSKGATCGCNLVAEFEGNKARLVDKFSMDKKLLPNSMVSEAG